jgi:cell division protein FtsW (lipid II flippase)
VGVILIVFQFLVCCYRSTRFAWRNPRDPNAIFLVGLSYLFLIRAFVEVDLLTAFSFGVVMFYSINLRVTEMQTEKNMGKAINHATLNKPIGVSSLS